MKLDEVEQRIVEQDSRYSDIGNLPSNFYPYDFKKLMIRPFTIKELRLVGKAGLTGEERHFIRAVDMVIDQDASKLALGDYYYILLWLKVHSSPKTPYVVNWTCPERVWKHRETGAFILNNAQYKAPEGEELAKHELVPCKYENTEIIYVTNVDIIQLPETDWKPLDPEFDFPRVHLLGDIRTMLKDDELRSIVPGAQWLREGATMQEKIDLLEAQVDIDLFKRALEVNTKTDFGISESCTLHCAQCRAEFPYTINLEPQSFFQ